MYVEDEVDRDGYGCEVDIEGVEDDVRRVGIVNKSNVS